MPPGLLLEAVVHGLQVGALHAADGVSGAAAGPKSAGPGAGGHDINGSLVAAITAAAAGGAAGAAAGVAGAAAGAAGAAGALDGAARNASAESGDEPRPFRRCFCDSSPCPLRRSRRQRNRGRSPALRARPHIAFAGGSPAHARHGERRCPRSQQQ